MTGRHRMPPTVPAIIDRPVFQEFPLPRILPRGEIEGLDHTSIPRLRFPQRDSIFADRARRMRQLAVDNPAAAYLHLMAEVCDAQHLAIRALPASTIAPEHIKLALEHGMPPLLSPGWQRDAAWLSILSRLLQHIEQATACPQAARDVATSLRQTIQTEPQSLIDLAEALLTDQLRPGDSANAAFVMAALQVYWTNLCSSLSAQEIPQDAPFGVCPACASLPVASIVRVGGSADGCRYLSCPRCSLEWHLVRVTCSQCESTDGIFYHAIEGGPEGIKAESCDHCHSYRKIFYQNKQLDIDPVADDIASLALDMLMGEAGYVRSSGNPLLWQEP